MTAADDTSPHLDRPDPRILDMTWEAGVVHLRVSGDVVLTMSPEVVAWLADRARACLHTALEPDQVTIGALPAGRSRAGESAPHTDVEDSAGSLAGERADHRRPVRADREPRGADLLRRARLVRSEGWDDFLYTWSGDEVALIAYLLDDLAVLTQQGQSATTVLDTLACDPYGIDAGRTDMAFGHPGTHTWIEDLRQELNR